MLLMATLWLGMAVAVLGQDADDRIPPGLSHTQNIDWHEVAQRYGIAEAVHISFQLQEEEVARREMEQVKEAQRRDRELHKKVAELAGTSLKLYQRFSNPTVIHADTPELAKRCEQLAKDIKRLLR